MNCSPTIAIALLLMSLTAGTWFLYKTQKENLSGFFKFVAWFVIVASFCSMICCAMRCCMMRHERQERCEMGMGDCGEARGMCMMGGGMNKRIIIMRGGDEECEMKGGCMGEEKCCDMPCCKMNGGSGCGEMEGSECKDGKMDCCKKGADKCEMKMDMKKDSVTVTVKKK